MDISKFTSVATRVGSRALLKAQKHSPHILVGAGVVGVVASGVLLVRATYRGQDQIDTFKADLEVLHHAKQDDNAEYTKDVLFFARKNAVSFGKLYGPAVTLGTASIVSILAGHKILHGRHVAMVGAYKALEVTFDEYRKRVINEFGESKERAVYDGIIKEKTTDADGKSKTEKRVGYHGMSQYARFFDEFNKNYVPGRPDQNKHFLLAQEKFLNAKLQARGHLFLNEVYDAIGMEPSPAGQLVGWIYGSEGGDGYVSFGLDNPNNEMMRMFMNGLEDAVRIDFNVDGLIWEQI